jgi:hypothetical protein
MLTTPSPRLLISMLRPPAGACYAARRHAKPLCELAREPIAVACRQPQVLHVGASFEGIRSWVPAHMNGRHDRHGLVEEGDHGFVTPNSGRAAQVDVGQDAALAFERFDLETDTGTTLA